MRVKVGRIQKNNDKCREITDMNITTEKLFNTNAYMENFSATVLSVNNNTFTLDRTCFYPESGGQPGDSGIFNGIKVVDTKYCKETNNILHISDSLVKFEIGLNGQGIIDWEKRFKIMRLHSALHILYLSFINQYGSCKLRWSSVQQDKARLDVEYFEEIDVNILQSTINECVNNGVDIATYPEDIDNNKRLWELSGFPPIPCGGTHVASSSEIGSVVCSVTSKGKQGKRIYVKIDQ